MPKKFYFTISILFVLFSCKRDGGPSWDTEMLVPLVNTNLAISQLFPDSLLETNPDNSYNLVFSNPVYVFDPTEIEEIPATTITESFTPPFSIHVDPGQEIFKNSSETRLDLKNLELSYIIVESGMLVCNVESTVRQKTILEYRLPKVKKDGQPFFISITVPAAVEGTPGKYSGSFDISGYEMDLRGKKSTAVNTYETDFSVKMAADGEKTVIMQNEGISLSTEFLDTRPYYAKGYFGSERFLSGPVESDFEFLEKVKSGSISFEDLDVELKFINGIGVDAKVRLNDLVSINSKTGKSVKLNHPVLGNSININRAVDRLYQDPGAIVQEHKVEFTTANSNFKELLENLPDKMEGDFDLHINPLGNISGGNDFFNSNYGFTVFLDLNLPLSFKSDKLTLADTANLNLSKQKNTDRIKSGQLILLTENTFPFDAGIKLYFVSNEGNIIDSLISSNNELIRAGSVNSEGKVEKATASRLVFELNEQGTRNLFGSSKILILTSFTTRPSDRHLKIFSDYKLNLKINGKFTYLTQTD